MFDASRDTSVGNIVITKLRILLGSKLAVRPWVISYPVSIRLLVTNNVVTEELLVVQHILCTEACDLILQLDVAPVQADGEIHVLRHGNVDNGTNGVAIRFFRLQIRIATRDGLVLHSIITTCWIQKERMGNSLAHVQLLEARCPERGLVSAT